MNVPSHSWTPFELLYRGMTMLSRLNEYPFVINKHLKVFIFLEITSDLLAVRFIPKSRYFLLYIAPFPQLIERNTETKLQVRF